MTWFNLHNLKTDKAISVKEYAKKHHYSARTVTRMIKRRQLRAFKDKRAWWIIPQ